MSVHARTLPESSYFLIIPTLHSKSKLRKREAMKTREKGKRKVPVAFYFIIIRRLHSALRMLAEEFLLPFHPLIFFFVRWFFWHKHTNTVLFDVTATCCSLTFYARSLFLRNWKMLSLITMYKLGFKCLCLLLYLMKARNNFGCREKGKVNSFMRTCERKANWK